MKKKKYLFTVYKANPKWLHSIDANYGCLGCGRNFYLKDGWFVEHCGYACSKLCADFFILQMI